MLEYLMMILFVNSLAIDPTTIPSSWMAARTQMRFQRYSTCLPSDQIRSKTRTQCLTACLQSNYCETVIFQYDVEICSLFGDRITDGQLIADPNADTVFITSRTPFIESPPTLALRGTLPSNWYPMSVVIRDMNKDNNLDLVIAQYHGHRIEIFFGNGTGDFSLGTSVSSNLHPVSVAVGDFDNDTNLDFVSVTFNSQSVRVFYGMGNKNFILKYDYYQNNLMSSVVVDDFNGDSRPDFAIALQNANSVNLFLATNNGNFSIQQGFSTGVSPYAMASGRFNSDSYADLAVANAGNDSITIFLGAANGSLINMGTYRVDSSPMGIAVGKFNGDNNLDLVVTNFASHTISILLGNGDGTFGLANTFPAGSDQPHGVAVADMDRDGVLDIVVSYVNNGFSQVGVLLGKCDGMFYLPTRFFSTAGRAYAVGAGDFNGDTRSDVVILNALSHMFSIFINNGP